MGEMQVVPTKVPTVALLPSPVNQAKLLRSMEARAGIEPAHKGFADLSLTTWVPRLGRAALLRKPVQTAVANPVGTGGRFGAGDEI